MQSNTLTVGWRALAATSLVVALMGTAVAKERVAQIREASARTRVLPADASRSVLTAGSSTRVCETGAKWIRLDFRSLKLHGYDSLVLKSSGGDRYVFQGGHWNNRSFSARALRGSCVDIQPYFSSRDSGYDVASFSYGTRALASESVVVAGAGDICDSTPADCKKTSDLIVSINPVAVFTAGDNAYNDGTLSEYNNRYDPNWGRFKSKTKPTPGNHDYYSSANWGTGYFDYFNGSGVQTGLAGDRSKGYYSWDVGEWHFVALNTMDSGSISSTQLDWLKQDLAANIKPCTAAYFHHPRWSTGHYSGVTGVQSAYTELYAAKADLILVGHDHNYQRSKKINASGVAAANGFRQILVGTGGRDFYPFETSDTTIAEVRNDKTWGVLKLTLSSTGYVADFVPVAGSTFSDSVTGTCNKANVGTTYSISGSVTTAAGTAIPNVSVSNGSATVMTNASGQYTFIGLANSTYTLTPSLNGYTFSPVSLNVPVNGANVTGRNFTGTPVAAGLLSNGVPVTGLSGAQGAELRYTLQVPAGATGLKFVTSGGAGDADLYVRFGSAPTTSDPWKSEGSTNAETVSIATAQAGTYHVLVKGYKAFSGLNLTGSFTAGSGGGTAQTYSNTTAVAIPDGSSTGIDSRVNVSGRVGNALANTQVRVNITHPWRGDVRITLIAPDGTPYTLKTENSGDSADNINQTYQVDLSAETLNGTWTLRVVDLWTPDAGRLDNWSLTF